MTRRCSHCSHNGHNSRTCPNRGVKLFGVRLTDGSIRKSASMGNLSHYNGSNGAGGSGLHRSSSSNHLGGGGGGSVAGGGGSSPGETHDHGDGYASEEDFVKGSSSSCRERKKDFSCSRRMVNSHRSCLAGGGYNSKAVKPQGVPWTEEEHRMFLLGLQKLGKGDWRGIARNYVISRTPTQVASHAQKYFIRQTNMSRRKRRSSLFDIIADEDAVDTPQMVPQELFPMNHPQAETQGMINPLQAPPVIDEECESMDSTNSNDGDAVAVIPKPETLMCNYPIVIPAYFSPFVPISLPYWPGYTAEAATKETHEVVKPIPVHSKSPINVDELVGMSKLSLGESIGSSKPSPLSLKLVDGSNRQSAFHPNPGTSSSDRTSSNSPIHAV